VDKFLTFTIVGLSLAAIYAVIASGLVLTYTTTGIFNFAHGAAGMLAAFLYWQLRFDWGWSVPLSLIVILGIAAPLFGVILEVVHDLTAPRFGRRNAMPKKLSSEDRARRMLGLPLAVQLTCDDINQAYRRAAKGKHPDQGGSAQAFIDLAAARDILIHPGAHKDA